MIRVTQLVRRMALQSPDRVAVICGERRWSWRDFAGRIERAGGMLAAQGVGPGDRIGILADNSDRYLEAFYAAPWAGAILVPLNGRLSAEELAYIVRHSAPRIMLIDDAHAALWADVAARLDTPPQVIRLDEADYEARLAAAAPIADRSRGGDETAAILYTGGTTGHPKGVMLSHLNHLSNALSLWAALPVDAAAMRYLHVAPMFHVADGLFVHGVTAIGGCHIIIPRFAPLEMMKAIERHRITDSIIVPTMIQMLLDAPERPDHDLTSLQRLYYGAAPMPEALAHRTLDALPHAGLVQLYGQTEAGPVIAMLNPADHRPPEAEKRRVRSAGQPLPGIEIAIHDPEGNALGEGEAGEIVVRSPGVMSGYWRDPEQSARTLRDGWLHTGDGGRIVDGYLYIDDRLKDMIISGGENVYSVEVERAIHAYPGVAQCAVIGLPDPLWGERVHAIIVPVAGAEIDSAALLGHCQDSIARFKCPRSIEIRAEPLPVSGAGKILKRVLKEACLAAAATPATDSR